jgi:hypothetical protein
MAKSRYEKYVVRKPAIIKADYTEEVPEGEKIPLRTPYDTGPMVIFSKDFVPEANSIVEYGIVSGDMVIGDGSFVDKHKHDYAEIFMFLGTDPKDPRDLGAEVEFWIGEGKDMEKIVFQHLRAAGRGALSANLEKCQKAGFYRGYHAQHREKAAETGIEIG